MTLESREYSLQPQAQPQPSVNVAAYYMPKDIQKRAVRAIAEVDLDGLVMWRRGEVIRNVVNYSLDTMAGWEMKEQAMASNRGSRIVNTGEMLLQQNLTNGSGRPV